MKNKEKYWDVILNIMMKSGVPFAVDGSSGKVIPCEGIACTDCIFFNNKKYKHKSCASSRVMWLNDEEDRLAEFRNLPVDTLILVRDDDKENWRPRYFSKVKDNRVYVFGNGTTSATAKDCFSGLRSYNFAKLMGGENDD